MTDLRALTTIGPRLAADLAAVGIHDLRAPRPVGAAAAWLQAAGRRDCGHAARAIEGALAGVRWATGQPP